MCRGRMNDGAPVPTAGTLARMRLPPLIAVAVLTGVTAAPPAAAQERPVCAGADAVAANDVVTAAAGLLCIVNAERVLRGLPPVAEEGRLDRAAQGHSEDMVARRYFAHVSPDGRSPADRVAAADYAFSSLHENIAVSQRTARSVMEDWMASPGHCPVILAPEVVHLGIGIAQGGRRGILWTQDFALQQGTAAPSQDTAPAAGCPYERLLVAPGPAVLRFLALSRAGDRVTVHGVFEDSGAGRRVVIAARRGRRSTRKAVRTRANGIFRTSIRAPRGRGRVRLTATAPAVEGVYETGRATGRI